MKIYAFNRAYEDYQKSLIQFSQIEDATKTYFDKLYSNTRIGSQDTTLGNFTAMPNKLMTIGELLQFLSSGKKKTSDIHIADRLSDIIQHESFVPYAESYRIFADELAKRLSNGTDIDFDTIRGYIFGYLVKNNVKLMNVNGKMVFENNQQQQ